MSYTAGCVRGFNLRIDGLYLTQSVQTYTGAVPLVKDRDGYLRVFVTATQSNLAAPAGAGAVLPSPALVTKDHDPRANGLVRAALAQRGQPRRLVERAGARSAHSAET